MNNDYNSEDWSRLEVRWQEHYQRIDEIASREATAPPTVPTRWWRYVAAAVAVAVVAVSAVVWMRPQQPAPAAPMLAMNRLEVPADPVSIPTDEPEAQPAQASMAAPKAQPQREEVAMPSESQEAAPTPEQEPLLLFNNEADGLCLANNIELDCDDISRMISDLLI